ncbi:3-oxoacyl-[acyl-carrier-protein] synthase-3 [Parabacteroides sp. PF5-5]|uniref:3-oxoacyl-ACP synthase III family protein n=1 Tax=unclassified Parabacteroides TaxID=2649774 RepID=UPI00247719A6|nr:MULTISPECIES: ketoacyl-ACP synthase III [unclassified Parabacteroides]MDH6305631.1 3-oxoacyl-[acyl-carrier-protein] synthase-3 [Parabacteroides sp. PH5-39]MDH6316331.1 3-oxoacyl-[acyl-carrier-protein] synthase-3 [Parabacteroides sp. PF5-13]MDH6319814.1 3-oxoacyl-[acyl-carrier-protein] synthase-3 [Parabacteroides sp. PH5-13]MDH6323595.1 3-oxoacyl-[acyl-carrier-protein] synthase-3 [Parabacteroides sp. PH5-8]MDH6327518.1 3-oxoacyl-[acyl-carrier-protein] synthase-3 [Parabacteroides sp. PH5-41]
MFINATGVYVPQERVHNDHFLEVNGLTSEWIEQRTGIITRSKAKPEENITTMGLLSVQNALHKLSYDIKEVDLIISASYSPYDTVATAAHVAQREHKIEKAKTFSISSACSSFLNALEIVEGYFAMNKASKALILSADKNSAYSNEDDPKSGHLWGDAAAAFFISKERVTEKDQMVLDIFTEGLGHISKGPDAVQLRPRDGGIMMPEGRDVFIQACTYMPKNVLYLLEKNGYTFDDLSYFIGHQANMRIMSNIAKQLDLPEEKFLHNIEELGNTGSVSSALVYAQNEHMFKKDDLVAITVFGGGYSAGACLIKC